MGRLVVLVQTVIDEQVSVHRQVDAERITNLLNNSRDRTGSASKIGVLSDPTTLEQRGSDELVVENVLLVLIESTNDAIEQAKSFELLSVG